MFDLFRSRAKAVRYLLGALLLLVALSLVITLIPGFGSGVGADDPVVAEIGKDDVLTTRDVHLRVQAVLRNRGVPREMIEQYLPDLVNEMITERALYYQARRMGYRLSEADLALILREALPQLFQDGKFVGRDVYANYVSQQNMTIPEFEDNLRRQVLVSRLREMVAEAVVVSQAEIEEEFRRRNENIKIDYVAFAADKFRSQVSVTPEEAKEYFEKNKASYTIPEKRSYQVLVIDQQQVAQTITIPPERLRREYEANKDRYRLPERVRVRHILLKTTEKPKEEIPKIKAKAEELLKQLKGGADFGELAKKNSEDPGSAAKGGDLDWVVRGQTVKNFETAAFSLKPKELSGVIETEYGFHILQVLDKQEARLKPLEEVQGELAGELSKQMIYDRMQTLSDEVRAALVKAPLQAAQVAEKYKLAVINVSQAASGDPTPGLPYNKDLQETIASTGKGEVTPVVLIGEDKLALAVVTEVFPTRAAEFAEVESKVRETLLTEKAQKVAQQRAQQAAEKAAAGADLRALAQSLGGEFKHTPEFNRDGAAEGLGPASSIEEAFLRPVGSTFGPVTVGEKAFVIRVAEKLPVDMSKLALDRDAIVASIKRRKASERTALFEDGLLAELTREGKVKIRRNVLQRLLASYKG